MEDTKSLEQIEVVEKLVKELAQAQVDSCANFERGYNAGFTKAQTEFKIIMFCVALGIFAAYMVNRK